MSTIHAQIRLAGLHIYKVRAIIQEKTRGKNSTTKDVYRRDEKIIINNLERAREVFMEEKNNAETYAQYSKYSCIVELFEPHIFDNGELAYWPDSENYIEQFRK